MRHIVACQTKFRCGKIRCQRLRPVASRAPVPRLPGPAGPKSLSGWVRPAMSERKLPAGVTTPAVRASPNRTSLNDTSRGSTNTSAENPAPQMPGGIGPNFVKLGAVPGRSTKRTALGSTISIVRDRTTLPALTPEEMLRSNWTVSAADGAGKLQRPDL